MSNLRRHGQSYTSDSKVGTLPLLFHWDHVTVTRTSLVRVRVLKSKKNRGERKRSTQEKRGEGEGRSGMTLLVGTMACFAVEASL